MSYLVGKILLCLIVALLCGFVLGWLVWRSISQQRQRELADRWEQRFGELERDRDTRIAKLRREAEDHREQIPTLEASLAERSDLIAQLESDLVAWREKAPAMEERLAAKDVELSTLRSNADEHVRKLATLDGEIAQRDSQIAQRDDELAQRDADIATLRTAAAEHARQLAAMDKSAAEARDQAEVLAAQNDALRKQVAQHDSSLAQEHAATGQATQALGAVRAELQQLQAAQPALKSDLQAQREKLGTLRAQLDQERERVARAERRAEELAAELAVAQQARSGRTAAPRLPGERPSTLLSVAPAPGQGDDLKKIRGVGPVMEKTMNGLGIYFFRQVAQLTEAEIRWLAEHINTFPDRIERDQWVAQAARLQREKYGGQP